MSGNLPTEKYLTVIFRLADNADTRLVLAACDRIGGATTAAYGWGHAYDKIDELEKEIKR